MCPLNTGTVMDHLFCNALVHVIYLRVYGHIGKHRALRREVTCNIRLYFKIGWTSVKPR